MTTAWIGQKAVISCETISVHERRGQVAGRKSAEQCCRWLLSGGAKDAALVLGRTLAAHGRKGLHFLLVVWPLHSLDACLFLGALMVDHWYSPSPFWLTLSQALLFCVSLAVHPCFCVLWHPRSVAASPQTMAMGEVSVPFWCVNIFPAQVCSENRLLLNLIALPV